MKKLKRHIPLLVVVSAFSIVGVATLVATFANPVEQPSEGLNIDHKEFAESFRSTKDKIIKNELED